MNFLSTSHTHTHTAISAVFLDFQISIGRLSISVFVCLCRRYFFHGSCSRRLRQIDSDSFGKKTTMFAVYQTLRAHSCSVDWGKESCLSGNTRSTSTLQRLHGHSSASTHNRRRRRLGELALLTFFCHFLPTKDLFRNMKQAHHILETFQDDLSSIFWMHGS